VAEVCDEFGVTIIGGDTIGSDKILRSKTMPKISNPLKFKILKRHAI